MTALLTRLIALLALALAAPLPTAHAQPAAVAVPPTIRVIVPFAPGAGTDVLARAVANLLAQRLSTNVIVENRAGGGGMIGTAAVAKGPKDGSMLLFHSSSLITAAATMKVVPVDVTTDLTPVALVADGPMLVGVSAASGIKTPAELVAAARTKPDGITAGSGGIGSVGHLAAELLNDAAKVQIRHIPYKGAAPALTDVAAGTVDLLIASYSTMGPQIRAGRVVPIAVTSAQPSAAYPGVPPMGSAAPGYQTGIWYGMFAPAGVPPALLNRLNAEIVDIARGGEVQALVKADGAAAVLSSPEELAPRIRRELATWKKLAVDKQIVVE